MDRWDVVALNQKLEASALRLTAKPSFLGPDLLLQQPLHTVLPLDLDFVRITERGDKFLLFNRQACFSQWRKQAVLFAFKKLLQMFWDARVHSVGCKLRLLASKTLPEFPSHDP